MKAQPTGIKKIDTARLESLIQTSMHAWTKNRYFHEDLQPFKDRSDYSESVILRARKVPDPATIPNYALLPPEMWTIIFESTLTNLGLIDFVSFRLAWRDNEFGKRIIKAFRQLIFPVGQHPRYKVGGFQNEVFSKSQVLFLLQFLIQFGNPFSHIKLLEDELLKRNKEWKESNVFFASRSSKCFHSTLDCCLLNRSNARQKTDRISVPLISLGGDKTPCDKCNKEMDQIEKSFQKLSSTKHISSKSGVLVLDYKASNFIVGPCVLNKCGRLCVKDKSINGALRICTFCSQEQKAVEEAIKKKNEEKNIARPPSTPTKT